MNDQEDATWADRKSMYVLDVVTTTIPLLLFSDVREHGSHPVGL